MKVDDERERFIREEGNASEYTYPPRIPHERARSNVRGAYLSLICFHGGLNIGFVHLGEVFDIREAVDLEGVLGVEGVVVHRVEGKVSIFL